MAICFMMMIMMMIVVVHVHVQTAAVAVHDPMSFTLSAQVWMAVVKHRHIKSGCQDGDDQDSVDEHVMPVLSAIHWTIVYGDAEGRSTSGRRAIAFSGGEDLEEVVMIPSCPEAFGFDASLGGGFAFEHVQGDPPVAGEVRRTVPLADAALILAKAHIQ